MSTTVAEPIAIPADEPRSTHGACARVVPDDHPPFTIGFRFGARIEQVWSLTAMKQFQEISRDGTYYRLLGQCDWPDGKKPPRAEMMAGAYRVWVEFDPDPDHWHKPAAGTDEAEREAYPGALDEWRAATLAKIEALQPKPSAVIDSGRGYWCEWTLDRLYYPEQIEAANYALAVAHGGDKCWNINRLGRMWGGFNQKTGRPAKLVYWDKSLVYTLDDFPAQNPRPSGKADGAKTSPEYYVAANVQNVELDKLVEDFGLPDDLKEMIVEGQHPGHPSRSETLFRVLCQLVRYEVDEGLILGVVLDKRNRVSASLYKDRDGKDIRDPEASARRQLARAKQSVDEAPAPRQGQFSTDKEGKPLPTPRNFRLALDLLGVTIRHNAFEVTDHISGLDLNSGKLSDRASIELRLLLEERFRLKFPKERANELIENTADRNKFNPVLDYLDGLRWDGVSRLDTWLIDHGGVADSPYARAVSSLVLMAAVRRIKQPGCKFDEMLVLESEQGWSKSETLQMLAGGEDFFTDGLPLNADGKGVVEQTQGKWIVEVAELSGMSKAEVEHVKAMLSRPVDRARMAYGRFSNDYPRKFVCIGTTNNDKYLKDQTGNRRFWPVRLTKPLDYAAVAAVRDQLWAEAVYREREAESIRLPRQLWADAGAEQEKRTQDLPEFDILNKHLGEHTGKIRNADLWLLVGGHTSSAKQTDLRAAMQKLGWTYEQKLRFGGGRAAPKEQGWWKGNAGERLFVLEPRRDHEGVVRVLVHRPTPQALGAAKEHLTGDEWDALQNEYGRYSTECPFEARMADISLALCTPYKTGT